MTDKEIFEAAIKKFGTDHQIDIAIEEMAELTKALLKHRRFPSAETKEDIQEEIADVKIIMEQLYIIFYSKHIDHVIIKKLERLKQTLEL